MTSFVFGSIYGSAQAGALMMFRKVYWLCRSGGGRTTPLPFAMVVVEVRAFLLESLYKMHC